MSTPKRWLDDERYIRMAGFLLLLSPFANFFVSVAAASASPQNLTVPQLWVAFINVSAITWVMRVLRVVVGILMIRGKASAWIPVMAILGFTIAYNLMTFKRDYSISPMQAILSIATNVFFFLLVFRAEFRITQEINDRIKAAKEKKAQALKAAAAVAPIQEAVPPKATSISNPVAADKTPEISKVVPLKTAPKRKKVVGEIRIPKGAIVAFEGHGVFGKVLFCTADELWLESPQGPPTNLQDRAIVLDSKKPKGSIRLRYDRTQDRGVLVFKVVT